jgi:hypothetical protein
MIIRLPWPDKKLSPNARLHWKATYAAKKKYKDLCAWELIDQGVKPLNDPPKRLFVKLTFYPPANYRFDADNLVSSTKYGLDMIANRLGVDDYIFAMQRPIIEKSQGKPGFVLVEITETEE